jgi:hypothetical protein
MALPLLIGLQFLDWFTTVIGVGGFNAVEQNPIMDLVIQSPIGFVYLLLLKGLFCVFALWIWNMCGKGGPPGFRIRDITFTLINTVMTFVVTSNILHIQLYMAGIL